MKFLLTLFCALLGSSYGQPPTAADPKQLDEEMMKNREYQCVAGCFSLTKDGKSTGPKQQPDCISDFRSISQDCDELSKKLSPIEKETGRYHVGSSTKKNWHEASRFCRENGMQLAGLESENENRVVGALLPQVKEEYWIAGCDHVADNQWYWVETGEDFQYKNFAEGEPNNYQKKDILRCVYITSEPGNAKTHLKWSDANCDEERKFICEMPEICFKQYCNSNTSN